MNAQEQAWQGEFGNAYNLRSPGDEESNYEFFVRALVVNNRGHYAWREIRSVVELGAGTGANLRALRRILPDADQTAVEINAEACRAMRLSPSGPERIVQMSLLEWTPVTRWDLAFTKGVLIHIPPEHLPTAYAKLFEASARYILIAEYYNPKPIEIPYRGQTGLLWKRDFAGEMLDSFPLRLLDYGFVYHRDPHPQDDINWFLFEKR